MKTKISRKIILELTLDSSEAIMFTKGGQHTTTISSRTFFLDPPFSNDEKSDNLEIKEDSIEISIQLERNEQGRFDFINSEANKHKEREYEN